MLFKQDNNRIEIPVVDDDGSPLDANDFTVAKFSIMNARTQEEVYTASLGDGITVENQQFVIITNPIDMVGDVLIELRVKDVSGNASTLLSLKETINYTRITL